MTAMQAKRTLRISGHTGVRVESVLSAVLVAELLAPSEEIWLVSPWVTDMDVIDNSAGSYDALFGDTPPLNCRWSDVLAQLCANGTRLHVVTRPVPHNDAFLRRLVAQAPGETVRVTRAVEVHEKTFCGDRWLLTGSMNFTVSGMTVNDEVVEYSIDETDCSQARLDLNRRWEEG
jgi:phosphatidylserine/phosphatidylglycerophosphate/cardiolipin synthase-like enzyme